MIVVTNRPTRLTMTRLHRNNAAEWVMWLLLLPAFAVVWTAGRMRKMGRR